MRVRFATGALAELAAELDHLGLHHVIVLSTPEQADLAERVHQQLGSRSAGVYALAKMHVPAAVADDAIGMTRRLGADGCVAIGGGSTVGLGKAIALRSGLPIIAIPTTYAGSEMTPLWGITENGEKLTGRDPRVLPASVIYDPELTATLPASVSIESGINAIAHAVEAIYAPDASPIVSLMAEASVAAFAASLPVLKAQPHDADAREQAQYGSWLAGACLGATTMGLHHKLAHMLGGSLDLPHASTHSVLLPYVFAFNAPAAPEAVAAVGRALHSSDPVDELFGFTRELGATSSLTQLGVTESDLAPIVKRGLTEGYSNPRPVTPADIHDILWAALHGLPIEGLAR